MNLLEKYKNKSPEIVFEWQDTQTCAKGWVVINSLRNGAAGGGTRMRKGLTKEEVISLAKVMEIKFSVCGPNIGGAKSGIDFDSKDPRREEVLYRWYKAIFPLLKTYYGTGGDLNVDEIRDVIPITETLGLWHPQEGIVNGHLQSANGEKIKILGQLRHGCSKTIEDARFVQEGSQKFTVSDMITGYGVAEAVRHYYQMFKQSSLQDKRVIVQGWGNVASSAASYLSLKGAKIVGIIDKCGGLIHQKGLELEEIKRLFASKIGNELTTPSMLSFEDVNKRIWDIGADIFVPGAASKIVNPNQVSRMLDHGLECISCGANVPFEDDGVFFGSTAINTDKIIGLIPDFIANSGMARVFAYFMQHNAVPTDEAIFNDVSQSIQKALVEIYNKEPGGTHLTHYALEIALNKLMN